jgi:hypothetical protein
MIVWPCWCGAGASPAKTCKWAGSIPLQPS